MPIRKLSLLLINQIAAGEVIERPASVVKELVENSLDAGSRRIDITIEEGGKQLIRISDDGQGIPSEELTLALSPHATSKLSSPEDLAAIGTMGFRGEALAAIASVSRLRLTSRVNDLTTKDAHESGATIESTGDQMSDVAPAGCSPGTVIEVRDLFFNTPARRKFLRSASAEYAQISDVVQRIAMTRCDVAFNLTHNGRKGVDVQSTTSRRERCLALLGKEMDEALLEFDHVETKPRNDEDGNPVIPAQAWGLAGMPSVARATSKFQYLYLNGRVIRDRNLSHAIKEAYRGLIAPDKFPMAVVMIDIDPHWVDVNVHPAKTEVRFREPSRLHSLVLGALRTRLLGADLTPVAATFRPSSGNSPSQPNAWPGNPGKNVSHDSPSQPGSITGMSSAGFVDHFKQMAPTQKGFVYEQVRAAMQPTVAPSPLLDRPTADSTTTSAGLADTPVKTPSVEGNDDLNDQPRLDAWSQAHANAGQPAPPPPILRSMGVLQVHESYLVTQDDHGMLIIDQHALHERVMFEELRQRITQRPLESQRLLMPAVLQVTQLQMDLLESLGPLFERIGIEASPIGPTSIGIQAFPSLLFHRKVEPVAFLTDLLDRAQEGQLDVSSPTAVEASLHEVLDMMACKAAVKAGDSLTPEELASLLAKREEIERSGSCPHGRPTTIRLTLRDLEKHFKRS